MLLLVVSVVIGWQMRSGLGLVADIGFAVGASILMTAFGADIVIGAVALARRLPLAPVSVLLGLAVVIPLALALSPMTLVLSTVVSVPLLVAAALLGGALGYGVKRGFGHFASVLLLTGSHDANVADLSGGRVYDRVKPATGTNQFKAALHVYRANHGQFNTEWGDKDFPLPFHWLLNKRPLLTGEQQRHITAVYVAAVSEATLLDNAAYKPMFQDYRNAAHWLPDTFYVSHYRDATYRTITNFGEDVDLTTATKQRCR